MIKKYFLIILFFILLLSSCSTRYHYSPDDGQLLALGKKDDFHFSGSINNFDFNDTSNIMNFQAGYSPIEHLAFQGSFFYLLEADPNDIFVKGKGHIYSGAVGTYKFFKPNQNPFYKKIKRKGKKENLPPPSFFSKNYMKPGSILDFYIGHARGGSKIDYRSRGMSISRYHKTFGQIGFHWSDNMGGLSYTFKFSRLKFTEAKSNGQVDLLDINKLNSLENQSTFFVRESSFRIFTGIRQAKIYFNLSVLAGPNELESVGVDDGNFTIGVIVDIDECFKKD